MAKYCSETLKKLSFDQRMKLLFNSNPVKFESLESIILIVTHFLSVSEVPFVDSFPNLGCLEINFGSSENTQPLDLKIRLPSVKQLTIRAYGDNIDYHFEEIVELLRLNPQLVKLKLTYISCRPKKTIHVLHCCIVSVSIYQNLKLYLCRQIHIQYILMKYFISKML